MEITSEFNAKILTIEYLEYDAKSVHSKYDKYYIAQVVLKESKRGSSKIYETHLARLFMTKTDFENKILVRGDRIKIRYAQWKCQRIPFKTYEKSYVNKNKGIYVRKDNKGRYYYQRDLYTYTINCDIGDWDRIESVTGGKYFFVPYTKVYFPLETSKDFYHKTLSYALDNDEIEKIKDYNDKITYISFYDGSTRKGEKKVCVNIDFEKNYINFVQVE